MSAVPRLFLGNLIGVIEWYSVSEESLTSEGNLNPYQLHLIASELYTLVLLCCGISDLFT